MARQRGFFPNFFLEAVGVSETRPAWFIMLLAAMATAAVWAGGWVAFYVAGQSMPSWTGDPLGPGTLVAMLLLFWAIAVPWYHVVYQLGYGRTRLNNEESEAKETRWEVWGGGVLFWAAYLMLRLVWAVLKYVAAPFIPIVLADALRDVPRWETRSPTWLSSSWPPTPSSPWPPTRCGGTCGRASQKEPRNERD